MLSFVLLLWTVQQSRPITSCKVIFLCIATLNALLKLWSILKRIANHAPKCELTDYARNTYFSAGDTTTRRIEANCNQLKMLLGRRPRIDKSARGIIKHHTAVIRQYAIVLCRHASKTRQVGAVPLF